MFILSLVGVSWAQGESITMCEVTIEKSYSSSSYNVNAQFAVSVDKKRHTLPMAYAGRNGGGGGSDSAKYIDVNVTLLESGAVEIALDQYGDSFLHSLEDFNDEKNNIFITTVNPSSFNKNIDYTFEVSEGSRKMTISCSKISILEAVTRLSQDSVWSQKK